MQQNYTNSGYVKTVRTKPIKPASKPSKPKNKGTGWVRVDKRSKAH